MDDPAEAAITSNDNSSIAVYPGLINQATSSGNQVNGLKDPINADQIIQWIDERIEYLEMDKSDENTSKANALKSATKSIVSFLVDEIYPSPENREISPNLLVPTFQTRVRDSIDIEFSLLKDSLREIFINFKNFIKPKQASYVGPNRFESSQFGQLINSPLDMMALDEGYVSPSTTLESVKMEPSPVKIVKKRVPLRGVKGAYITITERRSSHIDLTSEDEGPSEAAGHINEKSNDSDVESVAESLDWDWLSAPLDTTPKKSKNALCDKMAGAIEEIDANMNDDIQIVAHPKANKPFPSNSGEDHFPEFGEAEASSSILPQNNIPPWHHSASQEVPQITENRTPTRNGGFIPPNNRKRYFDHENENPSLFSSVAPKRRISSSASGISSRIEAIHIHDVQQITMDEDGQRAPGRSCLRAEADYGLHKNLSVSFDLQKTTVVTFQINEGNKMSIQTKEVNTMGSVVQSIRTQRYLNDKPIAVPDTETDDDASQEDQDPAQYSVHSLLKDITFRNDDIADRSEMAEREAEANEDNNDVSVRGDGHEMEGNLPRLNRWLITDALLHNLDERIFKNLHITRLEHPREYRSIYGELQHFYDNCDLVQRLNDFMLSYVFIAFGYDQIVRGVSEQLDLNHLTDIYDFFNEQLHGRKVKSREGESFNYMCPMVVAITIPTRILPSDFVDIYEEQIEHFNSTLRAAIHDAKSRPSTPQIELLDWAELVDAEEFKNPDLLNEHQHGIELVLNRVLKILVDELRTTYGVLID